MPEEEIEAKKPKLVTAYEVKPQCGHWVHRKKRFCKMTVAKNQKYCGEHLPAIVGDANQTEEEAPTEESRVPCPLDGKHTVFKKNLQKHMKICNARPRDDNPEYIVKGVNCGDNVDVGETTADVNIKLNELSDAEFYATIEKVKKLYATCVEGKIATVRVQHKSLDTELQKEEYGKESKKHLIQAAALLGILEEEQQLRASTSYVEFGAGKGQLAYFLAGIIASLDKSQVVLLDRMSLRHKKDNKVTDRSLVHRIRVDIGDFRMNKLDLLLQTQHRVAVSKHLCGGATDLALRCISAAKSENLSTDFIMIAVCCHHRCDWRSFCGKQFFAAHELTPRDFAIICRMVSWAICGTGYSRERRRALEEQSLTPQEVADLKSAQRLTIAQRAEVGLMCKRLLDYGRVEYLRTCGFEAELKYYVSSEVTLENVCLLARSKAKG